MGEGSRENVLPAQLVERIGQGDRHAEDQFAQLYRGGILVLVRRHCRPNDPQVDDLAQDVLVIVLEHLRARALENPAALQSYIRSTVTFVTAAEYRKRGRRGDTLPIEAADAAADGEDPSSALASAQLASRVDELLRHLPVARDRELLRQFYVLERSKDDVCRNLGIDPSHFHRVAYRARERMREILESSGMGQME